MSQNKYFSTEEIEKKEELMVQKTPKKNYFEIVQNYLIKKWWLVLLVTVTLAFTFVSIFAYIAFSNQGDNIPSYNNIDLKLKAPTTVSKGSPAEWSLTISNKETSSLSDISVKFNFDPNFEFISSSSITPIEPSGSLYSINRIDQVSGGLNQSVISFKGTSKGNVDEDIVISAEITYTVDNLIRLKNSNKLPEGISTRKTIKSELKKSKTTAPKVSMLMSVSDEVITNNNETTVNLEIENLSEQDIRDLRIRYYYPQGFTYISSNLSTDNVLLSQKEPSSGNNIWNLENLQRLDKRKLTLTGSVTGAPGASLTFRADIEIRTGDSWDSLSTISRDITIASKPLDLSTSIINGNLFEPGQTLNFVIYYENQGTNIVKNAEITASVSDPANLLDFNTIQFEGGLRGNYNNKTITWSGNNLPQLANLGIKSKGELRYSIKLKDEENFLNTLRNQNDYVIIPQASANGNNIQPIQITGETYKAKSDLIFKQTITPLNFEEGQTNRRRFRVLWEINTRQNTVNNVIVRTRSILETDAWNPSSITPTAKSAQITYNPQNGEIIWNVGNVTSYTGLSNPVQSISFDLEVESPIGGNDKVELYKQITLSGNDDFNGQTYSKAIQGQTVQFKK